MFQEKNEKRQKYILIFTIINLVILLIIILGTISTLLLGTTKALTQTLLAEGFENGLEGYAIFQILFQIFTIIMWLITISNNICIIFSVVEMVKFKTKYSIISSILTISMAVGISFLMEWTMIPRLIQKLMWIL